MAEPITQPPRSRLNPAKPATQPRTGLTKNMGTPPRRTCTGYCPTLEVRSARFAGNLWRGCERWPPDWYGRTGPRGPATVRWQARSREEGSWCEDTAGNWRAHYVPSHPGSDLPARLMTAIDLRATPQVPAIDLP
jgi:hypothetical protein